MGRCALGLGNSLLVVVLLGCWPGDAQAQEIGFTFGRFLGDEVPVDLPLGGAPQSLPFAEASIYGGRLGFGIPLLSVEASVTTTGTRVDLGGGRGIDARFVYAEAVGLVKILPGPIQPFLAAGLGWHRINWGGQASDYTVVGYVAGAGVRLGLGQLFLQGDLRDHITPLRLADLDPSVAVLLGLPGDRTLHNFELSVTVGTSF